MSLLPTASTLGLRALNKLTTKKGSAEPIVKPASWRGVKFAVLDSDAGGGRRGALHEYPGKEVGWVEDMGRKQRRFRLQGFILDGDLLLNSDEKAKSGDPIKTQRENFIKACEAKGTGKLVHPTLGEITCLLENFSISEGLDAQNTSHVEMDLIESGAPQAPKAAKQDETKKKASKLKSALIKIAAQNIATLVSGGSIGLSTLLSQATGVLSLAGVSADTIGSIAGWSAKIVSFAQDASALFRITSTLPASATSSFGRYSGGANVGLTDTNISTYTADTSIDDLIADGTAARAAVKAAAANAMAVAATVDLNDISPLAAAVDAMVAALVACCADPADAIRILLSLISSNLTGQSTTATQIISAMVCRSAAAALTETVASYQPASSNDAEARIAQIAPVLDQLAIAAADAGEDDAFFALRECRGAIVENLRQAAATVPQLREFSFGHAMPALALAQHIYGDVARTDQLVSEVDPENPLFMPTHFKALAA
jgi:prophage DNA circulation protein